MPQGPPLGGHHNKVISWKRQIWCFVSPAGSNQIRKWYEALSQADQAMVDGFLEIMRRKQTWQMPDYRAKLAGSKDLKRLGELRWVSHNVQHRLIGFMDNNDFVALIGCTHKQQRYQPAEALKTAVIRRGQLDRREATRVPYDF